MEHKEKETAKSKLVILAAAVSMVIVGFALSVTMRGASSPVGFGTLITRKPGAPVILAGFILVLLSGVTLIFRRQMGLWASRFRRWVADFFPTWKQLSGLPDEQVEHYLTHDFGKKMVVVAAVIDLCIGLCLLGIGFALNLGG